MNGFPISKNDIESALKIFLHNQNTLDRIAWWLEHGSACEHWFAFEFAYQLSKIVNFNVELERSRIDLVGYCKDQRKTTEPRDDFDFGIEIKWMGNWYWGPYTERGLEKDIEKIKNDKSRMALFVWLFAKPKQGKYKWLRDQINSKNGIKSLSEIKQKLVTEQTQLCFELQIPAPDHEDFDSLTIHTLGYLKK